MGPVDPGQRGKSAECLTCLEGSPQLKIHREREGNSIRGPSHCPFRVLQILGKLCEPQVAFVFKEVDFQTPEFLLGWHGPGES